MGVMSVSSQLIQQLAPHIAGMTMQATAPYDTRLVAQSSNQQLATPNFYRALETIPLGAGVSYNSPTAAMQAAVGMEALRGGNATQRAMQLGAAGHANRMFGLGQDSLRDRINSSLYGMGMSQQLRDLTLQDQWRSDSQSRLIGMLQPMFEGLAEYY